MSEKKDPELSVSIYYRWPLIFIGAAVLVNLVIFLIHAEKGIAMLPLTLVLAAAGIVVDLIWKKKFYPSLSELADSFDTTRKRILEDLSSPIALVRTDGTILWKNSAFREMLSSEKMREPDIFAVFPDLTKEMLSPSPEMAIVHSSFGKKRYSLELQWGPFVSPADAKKRNLPVEVTETMIMLCACDETELLEYKKKYSDSRACEGIIALDNFDEALGTVDEVRRSLLSALVDRKISNYFASLNGIVKKYETDKYLLLMQDSDMNAVIADRFSVLEDVKAINIGNNINLTLSIGVGMRGESFAANNDAARKGMELALGRGGDQAVVISDGEISYFGGKSTASAKNSRVKARVKAHAFREILNSKDRVIVMGHKMADVDAMGAASGIWRIARSFGKKAHVVNGNTDASVMPFRSGFSAENGYPEDFFISGDRALSLMDADTLLVVVDVNRPSYTEVPELLEKANSVVVIDHHRMNSETIENPVLSYIEPYASSASEMVAEIIRYVDEAIELEQAEADTLYGGIVLDTQNFTIQSGVRTFEAAAFLRRKGADIVRVRKMFREDLTDCKAKAGAIDKAQIYREHFILSVCDPEGTGSPTIIGAQAANSLLEINGIKASVVLTPYQDKIYISARSIDEINVQVLMEKLGGGGHKAVAGAQLTGISVEDAIGKVTEAIDQMIEEGEVN